LGIKALVQRARPENLIQTGFSFPSGHAITAIVFVSLLIYSFKDDFKKQDNKVCINNYIHLFLHFCRNKQNNTSCSLVQRCYGWNVFRIVLVSCFWSCIERAIPGVVPAVKRETKEAKPIVPKVLTKTAKSIVPKNAYKEGKIKSF